MVPHLEQNRKEIASSSNGALSVSGPLGPAKFPGPKENDSISPVFYPQVTKDGREDVTGACLHLPS